MIPKQPKTDHLTPRTFTTGDAVAVNSYWKSNPEWERYNASVPSTITETDAQVFVEEMCARSREDRPNWALIHQGTLIGVVSLTFEQEHRIAVIGYGVHGDLRGRGLEMQAASEVVTRAFEAYPKLGKIRAHTNAENAASIRLLAKIAFSKEGVLRSNQFVKGQFRDEAVFGLLRAEWTA